MPRVPRAGGICRCRASYGVLCVADLKNDLSEYLALAQKKREPIVVTRHGKPYALIQPLSEQDLEGLEWKGLAKKRLAKAWEGEDDSLYDDL